MIPGDKNYSSHYPHFADEETEVKECPGMRKLVNEKSSSESQVC